ncbi:MAG: transporter permease [Chloroflexi bacterium]|jgi:multiple sugar transport system permease protein|nr:transporter permease [Chloroflexota bacterium]
MSLALKSVDKTESKVKVKGIKSNDVVGAFGYWIGIIITLGFILIPIFWIGLTSLKTYQQSYTLDLFFGPTLDNFKIIFDDPLTMGPKLLNSLTVGILTVVIAIPLAMMAAYAFSRFRFRGSNLLMVWVLTTQFIPPVVIILPFFNLFRAVGLIDTIQGLVILDLAIVLPYATWMIKGYIDSLPIEVEEAALVDGANDLGILYRITFPLVMPGIIVAAVFGFIACWNEFLFALIIGSRNTQTLQVGFYGVASGPRGLQWELMSATGMLVMVPILILSLLIRKHFVGGLTMGAVK